MKFFKKRILPFLLCLAIIYIALLIPDKNDHQPVIHNATVPFTWNKDDVWKRLENKFSHAKQMSKEELDSNLQSLKTRAEADLERIKDSELKAYDSSLINIEHVFFEMAPFVAINKTEINWYTDYYNKFRVFIKKQSQHWNFNEISTRNAVYSLLYGMRAAVEEVILQYDHADLPPAMMVEEVNAKTPSAKIFGIEVHSGDLLVSRGGAEVSALISRGNDYPGNFSHVALVFVDEKTGIPYLIEAHIEKGVAVSSVEQYEHDKKLRFMVLRPRTDLPLMIADPMLPQKAALEMFNESGKRHIPYDFKMNFHDSTEMFCSEVASYAYRKKGIDLWKQSSTISSPGVVHWLSDFGVENFITQMPSDLEYDPQLSIVAEWRDMETLYKDHVDNAVMDAMLEQANQGKMIPYQQWKLPLVRIIKGYCMIKNIFGKTGMIPEGMSATRALKNQSFVAMHVNIKIKTQQMANDFLKKNHYRPPYWQLLKFAEQASNEKNN